MRLAYRILNVFTTSERISGNPLCVFEDGSALDTAQMQALARQLNLSETTFILPSESSTAKVRIFTPTFEMPFAGHPTLGTAHVVRALRGGDSLTLEEKAGIVAVEARGDRWTLRAAMEPQTRAPAATVDQLEQMLSLRSGAVSGTPLWVNTGSEQLVIPLASADDVRSAVAIPALVLQHGLQPSRDEAMAYVWAVEGDHLLVRFFFTQHGAIVEDPATGSACANLGGYFLATGRALPVEHTLHQGAAVGRPSVLGLRVAADRKIYVSGNVIELGAGFFDV